MVRMNARPAGGVSGGSAGKRRGNVAVHGNQAAALPRVRKKVGGGESGSGRSRHVAATVARQQTSPVYDSSDSFENHVIDLRGSNVEDEDEVTVRGTPSSEELSVRNGNGYCDSDSEERHHGNGQWAHSNGKSQNCLVRVKVDDSVRERDNRAREHDFIPGQVTWAKYARFPWWPAQVIDENELREAKGGVRGSDTDVLVRFFGTYDYGWVDPYTNLSDFEVKFAERSRIRKKALQKGVEEAVTFVQMGNLPKQWEPVSRLIKKKKSTSKSSVIPEGRAQRKRKLTLFHQEDEVENKAEQLQRRVRIMRQLGLVAPVGSPFTSSFNMSN